MTARATRLTTRRLPDWTRARPSPGGSLRPPFRVSRRMRSPTAGSAPSSSGLRRSPSFRSTRGRSCCPRRPQARPRRPRPALRRRDPARSLSDADELAFGLGLAFRLGRRPLGGGLNRVAFVVLAPLFVLQELSLLPVGRPTHAALTSSGRCYSSRQVSTSSHY